VMRCRSVGCGMTKPDHAIGYAMHFSRSADAVIRVRFVRFTSK